MRAVERGTSANYRSSDEAPQTWWVPTPLTAPAPIAAQATGSQQSQSNQPATLEWCPVCRSSRDRLSVDQPERKHPVTPPRPDREPVFTAAIKEHPPDRRCAGCSSAPRAAHVRSPSLTRGVLSACGRRPTPLRRIRSSRSSSFTAQQPRPARWLPRSTRSITIRFGRIR